MVDVVSLNDSAHHRRLAHCAQGRDAQADRGQDRRSAAGQGSGSESCRSQKSKPRPRPPPNRRIPSPSRPSTKPTRSPTCLKKEQKKPDPKPKKPQPKLEFSQIENKLALLDKRDPQRQSITGATLNSTASLGTESGAASELDVRWRDMLSTYLNNCWQLPDWAARRVVFFDVRMSLKQDGSLAAEPVLLSKHDDMAFPIASETALRAIYTCAPFRFLPVARYERWREVTIAFDTRALRQLRNIAAQ